MLSAGRLSRRLLQGLLALIMVFSVLGWPVTALAQGTTVSVGSVTGGPGDEVEVVVSVSGNPGILGATFQVSYDEGLTLTNAANGQAFSPLTMTKPGSLASPCRFTWDGVEIADEDIQDGPVLVLSFTIADDVEAGANLVVSVTGDEGAVLDANVNPIDVTYDSGVVSVSDIVPGDLDGDKVVNSRDVIFARRYIVGGYAQEVNLKAADVNDDLTINSADVILMRRFIAGGYGVELKLSRLRPDGTLPDTGDNPDPNPPVHSHELESVAAKSPTCSEEGNIAYWHCTGCDKYFSDAAGKTEIELESTVLASPGHTWVTDEAIAPTPTTEGRTEGKHCAVCGEVLKAPVVIPPLQTNEYYITYDIANGDPYLAGLDIENPKENKTSYYEGDSFKLEPLTVAGYRFLGWYDGAGDDSAKVTHINATDAENFTLYAHWEVQPYRVQFESDLLLDTNSATYTVDKGLVLPTPKMSNYVFVGWTDDVGELYSRRIPAGTTGNIILKANWTSLRNRTYTNPHPKDPIIYEDEENKTILMAYEIGRIENVPLYTIKDFGYINGGITKEITTSYSASMEETTAESVAKVVANATTSSSDWVLSNSWSECTSLDEEWIDQRGWTKEEAETYSKSSSSSWNISNSEYGSTSTVDYDTASDGWTNEIKVNASNKNYDTHTDTTVDKNGWKISGELNTERSASIPLEGILDLSAKNSAQIAGEYGKQHSETNVHNYGHQDSFGLDIYGKDSHYGSHDHTVTETGGWNTASSYGGSQTTSQSNTVRNALSEMITSKTGYGKQYINTGGESSSLAFASTESDTDSYSSTVAYKGTTVTENSATYRTSGTKDGFHRWVVAGTAHVYGVVGYDIATNSFFTSTYTVMDDDTFEFEDYSQFSSYSDNENGVISFEIPYDEVMDVVTEATYSTTGLKVNPQTGCIEGYDGEDTFVVIPEYYNAGDGDVVKITSIDSNAFAGKNVATVILSDYITSIPDYAFMDCTSLAFVEGRGVTSIGAGAFAGCASLEDCRVHSNVSHLGTGAFAGADHAYIIASNSDVLNGAVACGAKNITLYLPYRYDDDFDTLSGTTLNVPSSVECFEVNGDGKNYNGLSINSEAAETIINKVHIVGTESLPVKIASPKVILNQSSITSPGISLLLSADEAEVGLRGVTTVDSTGANAMLCRNLKLYETASNVVGKLSVPKKLFVCGSVEGSRYLQCSDVETINQAIYDSLLNPHTVSFDADGGTCEESSRALIYGSVIGDLPTPSRDYYTFEGWYLNDNTLVTAETVLPAAQDLVLVARWTENEVSDWVQASEMPEDAQVVSSKWSYDLTKYKQVVDSYTYYRYCTPYDGIWNQDSCWVNGSSSYHEITLASPLPSQANRFADMGGNSAGICGPCGSCEHKREGQSFWWLKSINYKDVVDEVEHKESFTEPSGENISNVVEWVQYRAK